MSKRFTDSEKFRDIWYRKLSPTLKCFWEYLLSECNNAGIIDIDFESASFHIGAEVTEADISKYDGRVIKLNDGKYFIPKFIQFQQGNLNIQNSAHKPIIECLKKYGYTQDQPFEEFITSLMGSNRGGQPSLEGGLMVGSATIGNSNSNSNSKGNSNINNIYNNNLNKQKLKFEEVNNWESLFEYWEQNKKGGKYKNAESRNRQLKKLKELTNEDFDYAKQAIVFCIDNKYQGFTDGSKLYYRNVPAAMESRKTSKADEVYQQSVIASKAFIQRQLERDKGELL